MKPMVGHEIKHLHPAYQVGNRVSVTFSQTVIPHGTVIGIRVDHIDTPELTAIRYLIRWDEGRTALSGGKEGWHGEEVMKLL